MRMALIVLVGAVISAQAQDPADEATVEPPILPGNLVPEVAPTQPADVATLARKLTRAKESAAGAERLVRIGALAKVEAENRVLRVLRLEADLANAQLTAAQTLVEQKQTQTAAGEVADLTNAQAQLSSAKTNADEAAAKLKKAELDAATINLDRQRKLVALGSGRKSAVRKAEETLAQLKAQ